MFSGLLLKGILCLWEAIESGELWCADSCRLGQQLGFDRHLWDIRAINAVKTFKVRKGSVLPRSFIDWKLSPNPDYIHRQEHVSAPSGRLETDLPLVFRTRLLSQSKVENLHPWRYGRHHCLLYHYLVPFSLPLHSAAEGIQPSITWSLSQTWSPTIHNQLLQHHQRLLHSLTFTSLHLESENADESQIEAYCDLQRGAIVRILLFTVAEICILLHRSRELR